MAVQFTTLELWVCIDLCWSVIDSWTPRSVLSYPPQPHPVPLASVSAVLFLSEMCQKLWYCPVLYCTVLKDPPLLNHHWFLCMQKTHSYLWTLLSSHLLYPLTPPHTLLPFYLILFVTVFTFIFCFCSRKNAFLLYCQWERSQYCVFLTRVVEQWRSSPAYHQ